MAKKGTMLECLTHFSLNVLGGNLPKIPKKAYVIRNNICGLLGVSPVTGHRWFDEHIMPTGINYIKLQLLLELVGYETTECLELNPIIREMSHMLALSTVSFEELAAATGSVNASVMRWITGRTPPISSKIDLVREVCDKYQESYKEKRGVWVKTLTMLGAVYHVTVPSVEKPAQPAVCKDCSGAGLDRMKIIMTLAHLIQAAEPLAEEVVSDRFTEADRDELRRLTTLVRTSKLFTLSNSLGQLCSERARQHVKQQQQQSGGK